jgi:predicted nucleic acid-binding protein
VLYVDSSVLVKRYFEERGSDRLETKFADVINARHRVLTSVLTLAEVHAAFAGKLQLQPPFAQ